MAEEVLEAEASGEVAVFVDLPPAPLRAHVLVKVNGEEWGFVPWALLYHFRGRVTRSVCVPDDPPPSAPVQFYLLDEAPAREINLDTALQAVQARLRLYDALAQNQAYQRSLFLTSRAGVSIDAWSHRLAMQAACFKKEAKYARTMFHVSTEFFCGEQAVALQRIVWCGHPASILDALRVLHPDVTFTLLEKEMLIEASDVLPFVAHLGRAGDDDDDNGMRLCEGKLRWSVWRWTPVLLDGFAAVRKRQIQQAFLSTPDPRLVRHVFGPMHARLSDMRSSRIPNKFKVVGTGVGPIQPIPVLEKLVEVMPPCMRQLHKRATGEARPHLMHDDLLLYTRFMIGSGANPEALSLVQEHAHQVRMGHDEFVKYMRSTVDATIKTTVEWVQKMSASGPFVGDSCKSLCEKARCPFFGVNGCDTVGRAQRQCQLARAVVLKRDTSDTPKGTTILYATSLRKELDAKRTLSEV